MPDITMCCGIGVEDGQEDCPLRHTCYRHNAIPSNWQSFFIGLPYSGDSCDHYWEDGDAVPEASKRSRPEHTAE